MKPWRSFSVNPERLDSDYAKKLLLVARSLNKGVWELMDVPEIYIDMHLTLDQKHPEGTLKFSSRALKALNLNPIAAKVDWANVLSGKALRKFLASQINKLDS